jgi:integral membrane protein
VAFQSSDPAALTRYRILAWIVGTLLVILVFVGVPLKYLAAPGSPSQSFGEMVTLYVGVAHGWLFMAYLVTAALLARVARWTPVFTLTTMAAGLIPLFTFMAERRATAAVRATVHSHVRLPEETQRKDRRGTDRDTHHQPR